MESTAQYWKPVWGALERYWKPNCQKREGAGPKSGTLHLAQALSNRGRRGRKKDFPDAERLLKRLLANELILSFVPDAEQRLWRTVTRRKYQLRREHVRLQNQLESLLVLLCYKNWRRQQGHLGRERARRVAIWRRRVAMECGLWRSVLIGSATGFRTVWQAG